MRAYKCLAAGALGPFSGFQWPVPQGSEGDWVEAEPRRCASGIHACRIEHLSHWLNEELWEIELDEAEPAGRKLVAPRGRLVRRIDGWNADTRRAFAESCRDRVRELVAATSGYEAYADDAARGAERGNAASAAFVAGRVAELLHGPSGYDAERARQAGWLAETLGLTS